MKYTSVEKCKMDRLLDAFYDYISASEEFDIAYSERSGYVWLVIAEYGEQVFFPILGYDEMLDMFFSDAVSEEEERVLYVDGEFDYSHVDIQRAWRRMNRILDTLSEDKDYARDRLDCFIENWRKKAVDEFSF